MRNTPFRPFSISRFPAVKGGVTCLVDCEADLLERIQLVVANEWCQVELLMWVMHFFGVARRIIQIVFNILNGFFYLRRHTFGNIWFQPLLKLRLRITFRFISYSYYVVWIDIGKTKGKRNEFLSVRLPEYNRSLEYFLLTIVFSFFQFLNLLLSGLKLEIKLQCISKFSF